MRDGPSADQSGDLACSGLPHAQRRTRHANQSGRKQDGVFYWMNPCALTEHHRLLVGQAFTADECLRESMLVIH